MFEIGGRKLRKVDALSKHSWLGGVCAGIAYWISLPVWVVRLIWFLFIWLYGTGAIAYILLCIFLPTWSELPDDFYKVTGD